MPSSTTETFSIAIEVTSSSLAGAKSNSLPAERTNFSSLNSFRLSLSNVDFSKFLIID